MSIFHFPYKNNNIKGPRKHGKGNLLNMKNHLTEFAEGVRKSSVYIPEKNAIFKLFREQMNQAKK
jgi:hypothetical protein